MQNNTNKQAHCTKTFVSEPVLRAIEGVRAAFSEALTIDDTQLYDFFGAVNTDGKMLRSYLLFLFADISGGIAREHIVLATAVEMVHTASLLHDDVVDSSSLRREGKSFNALFGSKNAVLMGDFLVAKALGLLEEFAEKDLLHCFFDAIAAMSRAELLQSVNKCNFDMSIEKYFQIVEGKTAVLFAAASRLGCLFSREENIGVAADNFGRNFGIAYQLTNDYNNIFTCEKPFNRIFSDIENGIFTLPVLHCLSIEKMRKGLITAIKNKDYATVAEILNDSGSKEFSLQTIAAYKQKALDCLGFPAEQHAAISRFTEGM